MNEITDKVIGQILKRIYRDSMIFKSKEYFLQLKYKAVDFINLTDEKTFHGIIGFLPNTKYRNHPFVLGVVHNKRMKEYEITVKNPNL